MDNTTEQAADREPWFYDLGWNWYVWNIFVWLFPLVCLQGAIANACSFYVIVSNRKSFPYVTRQYLTIITLSDFLLLTVKTSTHYFEYMAQFVKQNAWNWYTSPRAWGLGWCIVYDFITYYAIDGAAFFQLGLTVDRLVAVAAPMKAKMILSHKRSWILLGVISAMALFLPTSLVALRTWDLNKNKCSFNEANSLTIVFESVQLYFGRVFLISSLIIGTVTICLLLAWSNRAAQRMQSETASANHQQQKITQKRQRSLIRTSLMLVFINIIFLATCLPWSIVNISESLCSHCFGYQNYLRLIRHFNTLIYVNNALNWPVYFMGRKFSSAFGRVFCQPCLLRWSQVSTGAQQQRTLQQHVSTTTKSLHG